jgi:hypothetical protein
MRDETDIQTDYPWLTTVEARGWQHSLQWLLETLGPLGGLIAPMLWIAQPFSRMVGAHRVIGDLAHLLETPSERDRLQGWLEDRTDER